MHTNAYTNALKHIARLIPSFLRARFKEIIAGYILIKTALAVICIYFILTWPRVVYFDTQLMPPATPKNKAIQARIIVVYQIESVCKAIRSLGLGACNPKYSIQDLPEIKSALQAAATTAIMPGKSQSRYLADEYDWGQNAKNNACIALHKKGIKVHVINIL